MIAGIVTPRIRDLIRDNIKPHLCHECGSFVWHVDVHIAWHVSTEEQINERD